MLACACPYALSGGGPDAGALLMKLENANGLRRPLMELFVPFAAVGTDMGGAVIAPNAGPEAGAGICVEGCDPAKTSRAFEP